MGWFSCSILSPLLLSLCFYHIFQISYTVSFWAIFLSQSTVSPWDAAIADVIRYLTFPLYLGDLNSGHQACVATFGQ